MIKEILIIFLIILLLFSAIEIRTFLQKLRYFSKNPNCEDVLRIDKVVKELKEESTINNIDYKKIGNQISSIKIA